MAFTVCDTSTLIRLHKGNALFILGELFEKVFIPQSVADEYTKGGDIADLQASFFEIRKAEKIFNIGMGLGEREVISLAQELGIDAIITDDIEAIKKAESLFNLTAINSYFLLVFAKKKGLIASVKEVMDTIKANGNGIDEKAYNDAIEEAGEE